MNVLIDESVNLELNIADLYTLFSELFPQDHAFFWQLASEEKNHAALLRSGKDTFRARDLFPTELLSRDLSGLIGQNARLLAHIERFRVEPPSREEAFNLAFELERAGGEREFQDFMAREDTSKIGAIFRELNGADKDHSKRILTYMRNNNVQVWPHGGDTPS